MYSPGLFDSPHIGSPTSIRAEPMAVGSMSPGSSPPPPLTTNQYLPSYLTGDTGASFGPSSPRIWSMAGSPNKQRNMNMSPPMQGSASLQQSMSTPQNRSFTSRLVGEKTAGPPITGIFETVMSPGSTAARNQNFIDSPMRSDSPYMCPLASTSLITSNVGDFETSKIYSSPAQLDPFYTQRDELISEKDLDESWVTVFGFPSAAASYILQQFSQYGTILEYKMESGGNWMHLRYQSNLQAKKALSKSGKVYGGSVMIGVKPCIEKKVMDESAKENSFNLSSSFNESEDRRTLGSIRPLTQAYKVSASERDVAKPTRTPQKSNNLISRTMDYMFGW